MCLLVKQPEGHSFTDDWLSDFFVSNPDGIGVMWAENNTLYHVKHVPTNEADMIAFYRKWADKKECAIHWRWKTHGDIDLENCHPYEVFGSDTGYPLYMMHNGVLSSGNLADVTKSDTWHYIRDIIRPALAGREHEFQSEWFKTLIESHIGSNNKFVMMDAYGNVATFNEKAGVKWDGCWMSNTYAWDAQKAGVLRRTSWGNSGYGRLGDDWDDYTFGAGATPATPGVAATRTIGLEDSSKKAVTDVDEANEDLSLQQNEDAGLYARLFFDELYNNDQEAYYALTLDEVEEFFVENETEAWAVLQMLTDGEIDGGDLLDFFDKRARDVYQMELIEDQGDGVERLKVGLH